MRPTNLGFRSPKERTAEFNFPIVTFDGRQLPYLLQGSTIGKSKRFSQYESSARRTGKSVGPGSYNLRNDIIKQWNVAGTPVIKPYMIVKDPRMNAYIFIGDQVVYDSNFVRSHSKPTKSTDYSELKPVRTSSAATPRSEKGKNQEILAIKNSPYAEKIQKGNLN